MDKTLERILSLLPTNEQGKIQHGAKKDFAQKLGFDSGDIVSMWIKGTSKSYNNYLYDIATMYGVSMAWLKGDSDEKQPAVVESQTQEVIDLLNQIPPELREHAIGILRGLAQSGSNQD